VNLHAALDAMAVKKDPNSGRVRSPRPTWSWSCRRRWRSRGSADQGGPQVRKTTTWPRGQLEVNHYANVDYVVDPMLDYVEHRVEGGHHVVHRAEAAKPVRPALWAAFLLATSSPDLRVKANTGQRVGGGDISPLEGSFEIDDIQYRGRHIVGNQQGTRCSPTARWVPDPLIHQVGRVESSG
jgi:hypothetical protein